MRGKERKKMRLAKLIATLGVAAFAFAAQAVVVPVGPFAPTNQENFDLLAPGSYPVFPGMAGFATFNRYGGGGALLVGHTGMVPVTPPNAMFGRGVDVDIHLKAFRTEFGGFFRNPDVGVNVNKAKFIFMNGINPVGSAIGPITPAFAWLGYRSSVPFNRVIVLGNGSLPGYVGMDNVIVR